MTTAVTDIPIAGPNGLPPGTVKSTDVYPATDVTDTTEDPTGTTKGYTIANLTSFIQAQIGLDSWVSVSGTSQALAANTNYIPLNTALTTFSLPTLAAIGDTYEIAGIGTGGWKIAQTTSSQQIVFGNTQTTTGLTGYVASTNARDRVILTCLVANTIFSLGVLVGDIDVV